MDKSLHFDLPLINRYDKAGRRYTSYPTALELHDGFTEHDYRQDIAKSNGRRGGVIAVCAYPVLRYRLFLLCLQQNYHEKSCTRSAIPR